MVEKKDIEDALTQVIDPHTGVSLVEMGLIKDIQIVGGSVKIKMTLTTPHCPLANYLVEQVREKAASVKGIEKADVELVF